MDKPVMGLVLQVVVITVFLTKEMIIVEVWGIAFEVVSRIKVIVFDYKTKVYFIDFSYIDTASNTFHEIIATCFGLVIYVNYFVRLQRHSIQLPETVSCERSAIIPIRYYYCKLHLSITIEFDEIDFTLFNFHLNI